MPKVLFITGKLQNYRIPILNIIGSDNNINLTVAHAGKPLSTKKDMFHEILLKEKRIWKFTKHDTGFYNLCSEFDVVVAMFYVQKLSLFKLAYLKKRNFKLIYWGIGVKASQNSKFDSKGISNIFRYALAKKSDAMIFYSDYPISKYISKGIGKNKLFVMHNTVDVKRTINKEFIRNKLIFVGTLNKSKNIFSLLENYYSAFQQNQSLLKLDIIGAGTDYEEAKNWVINKNMEKQIIMHGSIYDEHILEEYFRQAIACISPGQAGLSVLTSFGFGVPFITRSDSITGGERLNIKNEYNGILYDEDNNLKNILLDITINRNKYLEMGINAKNYYDKERSPEIMAKGFIEAVNYVVNK